MNLFAISGLINAISVFALGGIVYFKNRKKQINILYTLFCFFVGFWSFCYFLWQISQDRNSALFWSRSLMAGAIFIPICFLHFVLLLLELYEKRKKLVKIGYFIFLLFFIFDFTPWFVNDVRPKIFFKFWPDPGPIFAIFLSIWFWYCLYPCYLLIRDYKKFTGIKRQQIKYVLIGILIGYSSGSTNYFLWYNIPIPPYGNFIVPIFVGIMAYAVVRYRLMDIKVAVTRAGIFTVVYTLVLGVPFWLGYITKSWLPATSLAVLLASSGPFIYTYLRRHAEDIILKDQRRYQKALRELSKTMTRIRELDKLLKMIVLTVVDTVKVSYAGIYLKDEEYNSYGLKHYYPQREKAHFQEFIPLDSPIIKMLYQQRRPLMHEEIGSMPGFSLDSGLAIPCFMEDNLLGFLIMGSKPNHQIYTADDVLVF